MQVYVKLAGLLGCKAVNQTLSCKQPGSAICTNTTTVKGREIFDLNEFRNICSPFHWHPLCLDVFMVSLS